MFQLINILIIVFIFDVYDYLIKIIILILIKKYKILLLNMEKLNKNGRYIKISLELYHFHRIYNWLLKEYNDLRNNNNDNYKNNKIKNLLKDFGIKFDYINNLLFIFTNDIGFSYELSFCSNNGNIQIYDIIIQFEYWDEFYYEEENLSDKSNEILIFNVDDEEKLSIISKIL